MSDDIPQWFIGGPWHGKDRRTECPSTRRDTIAVPTPASASPVMPAADDDRAAPAETVYARRRFAIGRTVLTFWADAAMHEADVGDRLAEILLAPHRGPEVTR
ncbi:hypothetical protein [Actinomadura bangladeshensis]|uniref:Uncharacterized protein n=1 Tax=Actinomadura bangladeshensis TaxID=453573 RepID=A0A6L9QBZ2_9ACTN|nr:hypothetical protein [Actinomadura bangladeshensis]NEA21596.1 hypothetical protein [Actinomadura bangladeshensis]NEA22556.1 hypothetical protein [Actinomadura bangladeshensis]